jgi:hypothetical protein
MSKSTMNIQYVKHISANQYRQSDQYHDVRRYKLVYTNSQDPNFVANILAQFGGIASIEFSSNPDWFADTVLEDGKRGASIEHLDYPNIAVFEVVDAGKIEAKPVVSTPAASNKNAERSVRVSETQSTKTLGEWYTIADTMDSITQCCFSFQRKYNQAPNIVKLAPRQMHAEWKSRAGLQLVADEAVVWGRAWIGYTPDDAAQAATASGALADKPAKLSKAERRVLKLMAQENIVGQANTPFLPMRTNDAYLTKTLSGECIRALVKRGLLEYTDKLRRDVRITDAGRAALAAAKPASKGTVSPSLITPTENVVKLTRLSAQSCALPEPIVRAAKSPTVQIVEKYGQHYEIAEITSECIVITVVNPDTAERGKPTQVCGRIGLTVFWTAEETEWLVRNLAREVEAGNVLTSED